MFVLTEKASGPADSVNWPKTVGHNGEKCTVTKAHCPQSQDIHRYTIEHVAMMSDMHLPVILWLHTLPTSIP